MRTAATACDRRDSRETSDTTANEEPPARWRFVSRVVAHSRFFLQISGVHSVTHETPKRKPARRRPHRRSLDDPRHRLPRVRPFDHLWTRTGAVTGALRTQALEARAQLALGLARLHELLL